MHDNLNDWLSDTIDAGKSTATLDKHHEQIIHAIENEQERIPKLKQELQNLTDKLNSINQNDPNNCTIEELHSRKSISDSIEKLKSNITLLEGNDMKDKYLLKVSDVLLEYYEESSKKSKKKSKTISKCISDRVPNYAENESLDQSWEEECYTNLFESKRSAGHLRKNTKSNNGDIDEFITETVRADKSDVLNTYLSRVNERYHGDLFRHGCSKCPKCDEEYDFNTIEGTVTCPICATTEIRLIESAKPNFKEPVQNSSYFCYKRINHFNENLNQIQAKESTDIPDVIMDLIKKEIQKSRIKDLSKLSVSKMKAILKKLKLNKYYEHVPHIINKLNGLPPPKLSPEVEEKLRSMFKEIQDPFEKVCPNNRKNFLNYSYVLHKMIQLLSLDEFLVCFPLLKSRDKLHAQDQVWKAICKELRWEFIPSC